MAGKWTAGIVTSPPSAGTPTVERWHQTSVPGRPASLLEGLDTEDTVGYRTTFADPRSTEDERTRLALRGAVGLESVWINGTEHAFESVSPYFLPTYLEFEPETENELLVCLDAGASPGGIYETDDVPAASGMPGLWWDAEVQVRPRTFLASLETRPRVTDDGALLDIGIEVAVGDEPLDDAITLSMRPEGFHGGATMDRVRVSGEAGERVTVSTTLDVRDPALWWPQGYGEQHRYTVRAKLGDDATETTTGLRTIERTDDGLLVNGRRLRVRGVERRPGGDPRSDVERALDLNATLVRVRGHAPSPALYRACDEAGLLVWQDLPIRGDRFERDRATTVLESILEAFGGHPSLACLGIQDEPVDPFERPVGGGRVGRLAFRWRTWRAGNDGGDAQAVAASVPEEYVSVPITGAPGLDATATTLAPGWQYLDLADLEWLLERYPDLGRIVGAYGTQSVTAEDRDPATIPGVDAAAYEQRAESAEASLTYQANAVRRLTETLRRHESAMLVASSLRDSASGGGSGVLTLEGEEKPAYEALKRAFEPVLPILESTPRPGTTVALALVNDSSSLVETTVSWQAGDEDGTASVSVSAMGSATVGTVDIPTDADTVAVTVDLEKRSVTNRYPL